MTKMIRITIGKTIDSVFWARTWCSNCPLHSTEDPGGSFTWLATACFASSTKPTMSRFRMLSWT
jgi:hypothetical protein